MKHLNLTAALESGVLVPIMMTMMMVALSSASFVAFKERHFLNEMEKN